KDETAAREDSRSGSMMAGAQGTITKLEFPQTIVKAVTMITLLFPSFECPERGHKD
ncbi:hypothetical protein L195_g026760, partial [Trifolium pratense]